MNLTTSSLVISNGLAWIRGIDMFLQEYSVLDAFTTLHILVKENSGLNP